MSETPAYFILAQLFTLMSASLRLALAFVLLCALVLLLGLIPEGASRLGDKTPLLQGLTRYLNHWMGVCAWAALGFAGAELALLSYPNFFVQRGFVFALGLILLWGVQVFCLRKAGRIWQGLSLGLCSGGWILACLSPAFSRSNETALGVLFALPVALVLGYFSLWLNSALAPGTYLRSLFHSLWGAGSALALGAYFFWLYPRLAGLPPEGEFYPFLKLYDWFLALFVLLYLGNLYIDYWLRTGKNGEKPALVLAWNYGVLIAGLICLWFNASIFDTLAL